MLSPRRRWLPLLTRPVFALTGIASIVAISIVVAWGWMMWGRVHRIETDLGARYAVASREMNGVFDLYRSQGYGAFIHNFTDYVLRRDPERLDAARRDVEAVLQSLDRIDATGAEGLRPALETVRGTFETYRAQLDMAERLVAEGHSIDAVEAATRVSDEAAVLAEAMLTQRYVDEMAAYQAAMETQLSQLRRSIALGAILVVPIMLLGAGILIAQLVTLQQAEEARADARRDPLTNLRNRWAFSEDTAKWFAADNDAPLAMAIVDVDRYRPLLATRGRIAADLALMHVGRVVAEVAGDRAIACRLETDRFALAVPSPDAVDALAERIRARVETEMLSIDRSAFSVTVSVGIERNRHESLFATLDAAGSAMKLARRLGGNCVAEARALAGTTGPGGPSLELVRA